MQQQWREVKKVQEIEQFFQAAAVILLYQLKHLDTAGPTAFILPTKGDESGWDFINEKKIGGEKRYGNL